MNWLKDQKDENQWNIKTNVTYFLLTTSISGGVSS